MVSRWRAVGLAALAMVACGTLPRDPRFGGLRPDDRPFVFRPDIRLYTVNNGVTVALLRDRRTNLVTVDARYRVGAADDPPGRAGLAHLVEHLTFQARPRADQPSLGDRLAEATLAHNAFTTHDVTHYTATAMADRLPELLELEAQRLEASCAIDDAVFSRERDVVLEETAQRRTPWVELQLAVAREVWGARHPYARGLGTREIADVTRDEACRFMTGHYTPDRLVLVVTGDFDPDQIAGAIGARFARVTTRSTTARIAVEDPWLRGSRSRHRADVDEAAAFVFFPAPSWGGPDVARHELALERLRQVMASLDREHEGITDVAVTTDGAGRARVVLVAISVDDPARLPAAVDDVFARASSMFADLGPYQLGDLTGRVATRYIASYEAFASRGAWLVDFLTYTHHGAFMVPELEAVGRATVADLERYTRSRFVRARSHVALIEPSGAPAAATRAPVATGGEPDLAPWRAPVDPAEASRALPVPATRATGAIEEVVLGNGLRVLLAPDPSSALVDVRIVFPHGAASDPPDRRGRALAAANLLRHDLDRRYRAADLFLLGWALSAGTQTWHEVDETSTVFGSLGTANLPEWHLWRLSWLIDLGVYRDDDVARFRADTIRASAEDEDPAVALTRRRLFGAHHPYATPRPAGDDWRWLTAGELERHRRSHYLPRGATLIVAGGFDPAAMRVHVEALFGAWPDRPVDAPARVPAARPARGPSWIGTRDPSRAQVGLTLTFATGSDADRDRAARAVLRELVADRLRIVREGMGASYGVQVGYLTGSGGGAFYAASELDPARAARAATAILAELEAIRAGADALVEDFVRARRRALAASLADAAGVSAVADELAYGARRGLPIDHIDRLAHAIGTVTPADVAAVAAADLDPRGLVISLAATRERLDALMDVLGATSPTTFDAK